MRTLTMTEYYWAGDYSKCAVGGAIERYVRGRCRIVKSDGVIFPSEYATLCTTAKKASIPLTPLTFDSPDRYGCLCARGTDDPRQVLLPLDDETFEFGLTNVLSRFSMPAWEYRRPVLFWRGGASGFERPSIRVNTARHLRTHPHADVRITPWGGWESQQDIPPGLFAPRCDISVHFHFKYLLIVDGNCIASNHQWVFGSGAVPVMITHPENRFWFQSYLKPMVNYVPIQYDLSDLDSKLDWLVANDGAAKDIATNAMALAMDVFSPMVQRAYIDRQFLPPE